VCFQWYCWRLVILNCCSFKQSCSCCDAGPACLQDSATAMSLASAVASQVMKPDIALRICSHCTWQSDCSCLVYSLLCLFIWDYSLTCASELAQTAMLHSLLTQHTTGNAAFMDSGTVVYTAGHNIVLHTIADRKQRFIHGGEGSDGITAMALCPRYVANNHKHRSHNSAPTASICCTTTACCAKEHSSI
jgi:hypothetical protein